MSVPTPKHSDLVGLDSSNNLNLKCLKPLLDKFNVQKGVGTLALAKAN